MGFFPPGSAHGIYFEQYCDHCAHLGDLEHPGDCAVLDAHFFYGMAEIPGNTPSPILDMLIPRDAQGNNLQCRMFVPRRLVPVPPTEPESTAAAPRPATSGFEGGHNLDI